MKKGFTLIELLAVIVILAIIALIATPIVLNIINNTKKESLVRSAELYISGVEQAIAKENLNGEFNPLTCNIQSDGNLLCDDGNPLEVKVDGKHPTGGTIVFNNGKIGKENTKIIYEGKTVKYVNGKLELIDTEEVAYKTYANGDAVYFNVDTGKQCTDYTEAQSATGIKTGCMKFYAFNDKEGKDTLNLILDHNTTLEVQWNSNYLNPVGPNQVLSKLKSDTENWVGTNSIENYSYMSKYDIDYSDFNARLITAQEIAQITENKNWHEESALNTNLYYFDSKNSTEKVTGVGTSDYWWLYDYTYTCTSYGCKIAESNITKGYWTATTCSDYANSVWTVNFVGRIITSRSDSASVGVRPVITIDKSKLS